MAVIEQVSVPKGYGLDEYEAYAHLAPNVHALASTISDPVRRLSGRTVWMISSTRQGGGVAEGLPRIVSLLRQVGVRTEWLVIDSPDERFFRVTKRIHNQLHGVGAPGLAREDGGLYRKISADLAGALGSRIAPGDPVVVHDPQPLAAGAFLRRGLGVPAVWRCHVGTDRTTPATEDAWSFLGPFAQAYDRALFSLDAYIPPFLSDRAGVMHPSIDPLSHKNRELAVHKLTGILVDAGLASTTHPPLAPPFADPAQRLQTDGSFAPAILPEDPGILFRPMVTQVSRWDRLKGFGPLLRAFVLLKRNLHSVQRGERHQRRLQHVRLLLAGPDPTGVRDDPEAQEVFREICSLWRGLPPEVQPDIAVLRLPMRSRKENALMVNALQRCSTVVVQNSLREGFGLTVTEAMWKARPVLGTHAVGIRAQLGDDETGRLVRNPEDIEEIAFTLDAMLGDDRAREIWGRNARYRAARHFLIFGEVQQWLNVLADACDRYDGPGKGGPEKGGPG